MTPRIQSLIAAVARFRDRADEPVIPNPSFETLSGGVIGLDGRIPWRHPEDFKHFKALTMGANVLMGRATWDSIGRPLLGRTNAVLTSRPILFKSEQKEGAAVRAFSTIAEALRNLEGDVWFIGGARVYEEALGDRHVQMMAITFVKSCGFGPRDLHGLVRFPTVNPQDWNEGPLVPFPDHPQLFWRGYECRQPRIVVC